MTPYEQYSLWIYGISALIALGAVTVGVYQLHNLVSQVKVAVEANTLNRLSTLLEIERIIGDRREKFSQAGIAIAQFEGVENVDPKEFQIAKLAYDEARQQLFNALERLCSSLNKGLLNDEELRPEYRDYIASLVRKFPDDFGTGTEYRNIVRVYERWADI